MTSAIIPLFLMCVLLGAAGQLSIKCGVSAITRSFGHSLSISLILQHPLTVFLNPYVFMGFASYAVSSLLWLVLMSKFKLSVIYPMISLGYVFVVFGSIVLFHDRPNFYTWAALALIVAGVSLMALSGSA